jgi:tetratricopeptide (TPR) repeat protein
MLSKLEGRLKLLTGGARDLPPRQQTLRGAIEWSYDLLDPEEKQLFARLAVFVGGSALEAIEAVCNGGADLQIEVLDGVESLVGKSLLQQRESQDGDPRFVMLETIHEYAREKLEEHERNGLAKPRRGQAEDLQRRHAEYFLTLAEEAEPQLRGPRQAVWLARLDDEHDNLRAALRWFGENYPEKGLRLAADLSRFWLSRGYLTEGCQTLEALLSQGGAVDPSLRAKALYVEARLALLQSDYSSATSLGEQSLAIYRQLGDNQGIANCLNDLGSLAGLQGDYELRQSLHEQSLGIFRELGDEYGIATTLFLLANVVTTRGEQALARSLFEDSLEKFKRLGDRRSIAMCLYNLGNEALDQGDYVSARRYYEEGLPIFQELGDKWSIARSLADLGETACWQGDYSAAWSMLQDSLSLFREVGARQGTADTLAKLANLARLQGDLPSAVSTLKESLELRKGLGNKRGMVECLERSAVIIAWQGRPAQAATLLGAAETARQAMDSPLFHADRAEIDLSASSAESQLGAPAWTEARERGRSMALEQAVDYALGELEGL